MASNGQDAEEPKDPTLLFGGLVPPQMRRARQEFTSAMEHIIIAANLAHKIMVAEKKLKQWDNNTTSPSNQPSSPT